MRSVVAPSPPGIWPFEFAAISHEQRATFLVERVGELAPQKIERHATLQGDMPRVLEPARRPSEIGIGLQYDPGNKPQRGGMH